MQDIISNVSSSTAASPDSLIKMSTMTVDGMITNVKFDKETAINGLTLTDQIVEIGCNYGHLICEKYKEMDIYKERIKKTKKGKRGAVTEVVNDEGSDGDEQTEDKRKKQGYGTHFNSQITFTALCDIGFDESNPVYHTYQIKLFTNGRVQIPGLGPVNQERILEKLLNIIVDYIKQHKDTLMFREFMTTKICNLTPILKNYVSITLGESDCMVEKKPFINKHGEEAFALPMIDLQVLEPAFTEYKVNRGLDIYLNSAVFNPQRYAAMRVKFSTPQPLTGKYSLDKFIEMAKLYYQQKTRLSKTKPVLLCDSDTRIERVIKLMQNAWAHNNKSLKKHKPKQTTVKIFKSGKINIDHANTTYQAERIRDIVVMIIKANLDNALYYQYCHKRINKAPAKKTKSNKKASVPDDSEAAEEASSDVANDDVEVIDDATEE